MIIGAIKHKDLKSSIRFDGGFHLSESVIFERKVKKMNFKILDELADKIFTAGRSKRIYTEREFGLPYLSNSDIAKNNPFESCKYNSIKYAYDETAFLKEGMIVTGRVGAIGQTAYINSELEEIKAMGSDNIIRIVAKDPNKSGYLYSYLVSKYGNTFFKKIASGGVQPYVSEDQVKDIPIPIISEEKQEQIHQLIVDSANLRVKANKMISKTKEDLLLELGLTRLTNEEYEYFGNHVQGRKVSSFKVSFNEISPVSINAFNYSRRIKGLENRIKRLPHKLLSNCLVENGYFSTGSFKRLEINSNNGIKLINQSDIFNSRKIGKNLSRRAVGNVKLVEYGELLIAGVGTLGEGETFCRIVFSNEELENQLVSGEFIRLKTNDDIPSGYLFAWLSTEYGFRLIRSTQSGTKLCRPISELLKRIPVPILSREKMLVIDDQIKKAHTDLFIALNKENQAINLIENEIDAWQ